MKKFFLLTISLFVIMPTFLLAQNVSPLSQSEQRALVWRHNYWRNQAQANMLKIEWSKTLALAAKFRAEEMSQTCKVVKSKMIFGENIYCGMGHKNLKNVVDTWAQERQDYDYEKNLCKEGTDCEHYKQMVWAKTTSVGCASIRCSDGKEMLICIYDKTGDMTAEKPY